MSKFTIFTLFLSAIILVIVAELLVDQYLKIPTQNQLAANVLTNQQAPQNAKTESDETTAEATITPKPDLAIIDPTPTVSDLGASATQNGSPHITFTLVSQAGFKDITLQRVIFNGLLFDLIDIKDLFSMPVLQQHLLKNNSTRLASFYEFPAKNKTLGTEIYLLLKQKSASEPGVMINENAAFGDGSFYVNYLEYPERVFLVVKKAKAVYALTYVKEYHPFMTQLLQLL